MCGKVSGAGTKSSKVTVASREKEYKGNIEEFPQRRFGRFRETRKPRDRGGRGHEIVKELMVCSTCAGIHEEKQAVIRAAAEEAAAAAKIAAAEAADALEAVSSLEESE